MYWYSFLLYENLSPLMGRQGMQREANIDGDFQTRSWLQALFGMIWAANARVISACFFYAQTLCSSKHFNIF
jgi:hypothetical protein